MTVDLDGLVLVELVGSEFDFIYRPTKLIERKELSIVLRWFSEAELRGEQGV